MNKVSFFLTKFFNNTNFLILFCISIWLSIDVTFFDLLDGNFSSFKSYLINFRFYFPYTLFIFYICIFYKKIYFDKNYFNFWFITSILLYFAQLIGLLVSDNLLINLFFVINSIMVLSLIYFMSIEGLKIYKILNVSIGILFLVLIIYGYEILEWFYTSTFNLNLYGSWPHSLLDLKILSTNVPRSSGLSRTALIIFIYFAIKSFIKFDKYKFTYSFIFIFTSLIIHLTQSRVTLIFYLGFIFIFFLSLLISRNLNIKKKIRIFLAIFIIPLIVTVLSIKYKNHIVWNLNLIFSDDYYAKGELWTDDSNLSYEDMSEIATTNDNINSLIKGDGRVIRNLDPRSLTSKRFFDWKNIISANERIFFGYGSMGDRFLINQTASNGLIYIYASAGIFGSILYLIIYLRAVYLSVKTIWRSQFKINKSNYRYIISSSLVIFILFRSLAESSFAIFGIDFTIFFICLFILENKNKKLFIQKVFN